MTDVEKQPSPAEIIASRREYISTLMRRQGLEGNVRLYVVLHGWRYIEDDDARYEITLEPIPQHPEVKKGTHLWVMATSNSPDLTPVTVLEDRVDGLWVKADNYDVQFLVDRGDAKTTPIPLRPFAIQRSQLHVYIGDDLARKYHVNRARRILKQSREATAR